MNLSLSSVNRQEVSARIQQEKQLAALEAHQAEMQRKRDSPQRKDIHRSSSPGQHKSADQVIPLHKRNRSIWCSTQKHVHSKLTN